MFPLPRCGLCLGRLWDCTNEALPETGADCFQAHGSHLRGVVCVCVDPWIHPRGENTHLFLPRLMSEESGNVAPTLILEAQPTVTLAPGF